METAAFIIGVMGLLLAIVSIVLVFAIERARKPLVSIEPGQDYWDSPPFAHIAVSNKKTGRWLAKFFRGTTMTNCRASFEFYRAGVSVLGPIDGRWSGVPEPHDSSEYPLSYRWDLAATGQPEQIAIARTDGETVHAFSAESYSYPNWQKPEWLLDAGEYDIVVRLAATEAEAEGTFRLIVGGNGCLSLGRQIDSNP